MKRILRSGLIYALGNAANSAALLLVIPYLLNTLTPTEYGAWSLFETSIFFLNVFILAGLEVGLMREYWFQPDEYQRARLVGSTLLMVSTTGLVIVTSGTSIVASGVSFGLPGAPFTLFMVLTLGWSDALFIVLLSLFRIREQPLIFVMLSGGRLVLFAVLLFYLVESGWGLTGALGARLLASLAMLFIAVLLSQRWIVWCFDRTLIKRIVSYGLPMLPANVAAYILMAADRYVIQGFLSLEDVALYSFAYKIATVLDVLITRPFALDWAPRRFKIAAEPNPEPKYVQALLIYLWAAIAGSLGIIALNPLVYTLFAPPTYWSAMHLVPVILLAYIIYGLSYPLNIGIMLKDRTRDLPVIGWIAAIACLVLCLWWIPTYGITGAAWATVIAYLIWTGLITLVSLRLYPLVYPIRLIAMIIGAGILGYAGLRFATQWQTTTYLVTLVAQVIWVIIIMGGCGLLVWRSIQGSSGAMSPQRHSSILQRAANSIGLPTKLARLRIGLFIIGSGLAIAGLAFFAYPMVVLSSASSQLEIAIARGDHILLQRAINQLENVRQWHAQDALLYRRLAQAYQFNGQWDDTLAALEQAKALQPNSILISIELANVYLHTNNIPMAAKMLQDAGIPTAFLIEHANHLWQTKDYARLSQYLQLIDIYGEDTFSSRHFVAAQLARQQRDQAAEWLALNEAMAADRGWITPSMRSWAFVRYAEMLIVQKRFTEALAALETALEKRQGIFSSRDLGGVYRLRGLALQGAGDMARAEADFVEAVTLAPDSGWGWMNLGLLRYTTRGEGWTEIDRALALEPTNRDLWNYLLTILTTAREDEKVAWYCAQAAQHNIPLNTMCR